ncbi:hypothetical protein TR51_30475 [Kitasatospora griseola]|uniref:Uncharacterized protein n=1 Tax=Kitasatospora griseola TaxID=2064 RepID=A0A0D0NV87_KITGR|nr:hypothetical protein [Kitasatospora griseola]KIQ63111.1 hypothetical protein TR51_30475 [Kitasatospora griseola]
MNDITPDARAKRLNALYGLASRAIPNYAYTLTPDSVKEAISRYDEMLDKRADADEAVALAENEIATAEAKDQRAVKVALAEGKPLPKPTNRGPLETRLADAQRVQIAAYELTAEAAAAVRAAAIDVRADWRSDVTSLAEEKRAAAVTAATQLACLMDELATLANTVEELDGDLGNPWGGNERQWRYMGPRGGINWNADRVALDRIMTDRLIFDGNTWGGLPGRLDPNSDPDAVFDPAAGPSSPVNDMEPWNR